MLEPQSSGTDPLPPAGDLGGDGDGHIDRIQLRHRRQRHHRLIERDAQERGDSNGTIGLKAKHLEWAVGDCRHRFLGTDRKRNRDRVANQRRLQRLGRPIEVETVAVRQEPLGQPGDDRSHRGVVEWLPRYDHG